MRVHSGGRTGSGHFGYGAAALPFSKSLPAAGEYSPHMVNKVAVVTDSTAYLPPGLAERHHLTVIPLQLSIGGGMPQEGGGNTPPDNPPAPAGRHPLTTPPPPPQPLPPPHPAPPRAGAPADASGA